MCIVNVWTHPVVSSLSDSENCGDWVLNMQLWILLRTNRYAVECHLQSILNQRLWKKEWKAHTASNIHSSLMLRLTTIGKNKQNLKLWKVCDNLCTSDAHVEYCDRNLMVHDGRELWWQTASGYFQALPGSLNFEETFSSCAAVLLKASAHSIQRWNQSTEYSRSFAESCVEYTMKCSRNT